MAWANDDYIEVKDRIVKFYENHPDGRIATEIVEMTELRVTVKAYVYQTGDDQRPTTGHSWLGIPGTTNFTRGSELENAETSAVGRALALCGYEVKRSIASREEVTSKQGAPAPRVGPLVQAAIDAGGQVAAPAEVRVISEPQRKRMFAIANSVQMPEVTLKEYVARYSGVESSADIPADTYTALTVAIEAYVPTADLPHFDAEGNSVPA
jgi:hypothetical protein